MTCLFAGTLHAEESSLSFRVCHENPGGETLWDIVEGGYGLVVVGTHGTILRSTDGNSWNSVTSGTDAWLVAVTYAEGRYVAVGEGGTILRSTDGHTWQPCFGVPTTKRLNNVAYGKNRWIVVGEGGVILMSDDNAESWEAVSSPTSKWLRALVLQEVVVSRSEYNDDYWFASGEDSQVLISEDGRDWEIWGEETTLDPSRPDTEVLLSVDIGYIYFSALDRALRYITRVTAIGSDGLTETRDGQARFLAPGFEDYNYFKPDHLDWQVSPIGNTTVPLGTHWRSAVRFGGFTVLSGDGGVIASPRPNADGDPIRHDSGTTADLVGAGVGLDALFVVGGAETIVRSNQIEPSNITNLSSRGRVSDDGKAMVAGIVVDNMAKQLLVRAAGPSLTDHGIVDAITRPQLTVRRQSGELIAENIGWRSASDWQEVYNVSSAVGAFSFGYTKEDCALLIDNPADHPILTATVRGVEGSGVALVEFYDRSGLGGSTEPSGRIMNLSTRGYVGAGEDALVAGFTIEGISPMTILIRGIGPALSDFDVPSPLNNPRLELFTANGTILATNEQWTNGTSLENDNSTALTIHHTGLSVGAFPLDEESLDAALLVTLIPGHYTVALSNVDSQPGNGMIEIYRVTR